MPELLRNIEYLQTRQTGRLHWPHGTETRLQQHLQHLKIARRLMPHKTTTQSALLRRQTVPHRLRCKKQVLMAQ